MVTRGSCLAAALAVASMLLPPMASGQDYKNSTEHFEALKRAANGGTRLTFDKLPDWTGVWTRTRGAGLKFDPAQPSLQQTTAQLTPQFAQQHKEKLERVAKGIEWDPISNCIPPGYPRWLTEPFLREFVLRPEQTLLINEMVTLASPTSSRSHTPIGPCCVAITWGFSFILLCLQLKHRLVDPKHRQRQAALLQLLNQLIFVQIELHVGINAMRLNDILPAQPILHVPDDRRHVPLAKLHRQHRQADRIHFFMAYFNLLLEMLVQRLNGNGPPRQWIAD